MWLRLRFGVGVIDEVVERMIFEELDLRLRGCGRFSYIVRAVWSTQAFIFSLVNSFRGPRFSWDVQGMICNIILW